MIKNLIFDFGKVLVISNTLKRLTRFSRPTNRQKNSITF